MPKPRIFLSYRRNDSMADTRNIRDRFMHSGFEHVFMDLPEINPGDEWQKRIEDALVAAEVVIVVIGRDWLNDYNRRRLWEPGDPVHWELIIALRSGKRIIPALVEEAVIPAAEDLPEDVRRLVDYQVKHLTSTNWDSDVASLISSVDVSRSEATAAIPTIVLASKSPGRQQLLRTIGWIEGEHYSMVHASVPPDDSQDVRTIVAARALAERMACKKIAWLRDNPNAVSEQLHMDRSASHTILIGVDTIVFCEDKVLDRPLLRALEFAGPQDLVQARKRAVEMLRDQSGQTIHVITGLAVAVLGTREEPTTRVVVTEAKLRDYPAADIVSYVACADPVDKAGAFGIQDQGVALFERIKGSYTNVVGLPLREFVTLMHEQYDGVFVLPELRSTLAVKDADDASRSAHDPGAKELSVVCVGDINYDFVYDKIPQDFLSDFGARDRMELEGVIHRAVGGTAVNFAKGAKNAGFDQCFVVGIVGGDALGQQILTELADLDITAISERDPAFKSSVTIILRHGHLRAAKQVYSFLSPRILLASKSPQRRELLQQIVAPSKIQVIASSCPEGYRVGESPQERVRRVALEKAEWVLAQGDFHDDIELIIGADTEVVRRNSKGRWEMVGHPTTPARARRDLGRLNNGDHYVLTGLAVIGKAPGGGAGPLKKHVVCEQTRVTFVDASRELLDVYADSGEPIGRAGAYAIQGVGVMLAESVDGSYSNVVGLPLERLSQVMADEFGKPIWNFDRVSNWTFPDPIKGSR